jgi:hypothetical protein
VIDTATRPRRKRLGLLLIAAVVATIVGLSGPATAPAGAAVSGGFTKAKPMANARYDHASVRLANGKVLATGGYVGYETSRASELYTHSTRSWAPAASMKDPRVHHTATVLSDGRVLVTGGYNGGALATAEIYDPVANTWTRTGSMQFARYSHTATLLGNGRVLVVGGHGDRPYSSEIYDPSTGTFGSYASMRYYRSEHAAARVSSSRVLVVGTSQYYSDDPVFRTAEVYNFSSNSWTLVGSMGVGRRQGVAATALASGSVLITGGRTPSYGTTTAAEIFNPSTNTFSFTGDLNYARYEHEATRLTDGRVLVTGGYGSDASAEVYDPATGQWDLTGSLLEDRNRHTATLIGSNRVVIAGGYGDNGQLDTTEVFDPASSSIQDDKITPRIAWSGTVALVVWQDGRNGNADIYGARVDQYGNVLDPGGIAISTAAGEQTQPTVAWNGSTFLVAWTDRRSGADTNIYSTRVGTDGAVTNPTGRALSTAANDQSYPIARANGTTWLVVWQDGRSGTSTDIYSTRVTSLGAPTNASGVAISTATRDQRRPSVASNGTDWLVVWGDRRSSSGASDVYSTRVSSTGSVLSPNGVAVSTAAADQSHPQVAWNGNTFLVVWSDYRSGTSLDTYGSRVNASGTTLNASGIAISKQVGVSEASSSLSAIGTNFLVTWQDDRSGTFDIYSTRVSETGSVLSPSGVKVSGAANDQSTPAVGVAGGSFLVVWGDGRSGTSSDIYGSRVSTAGSVQDTSGIKIAG